MLPVTRVLYEFGPFRVDPEKEQLLRDGQPVAVTPKALETLIVLLRRPGEVVTREQLIEELWPDSFVEEANLSQNIFMLRKALGDTPEDRLYIVTLPSRGYRFVGKVNTIPAQDETELSIACGQTAVDVPVATDKGTRRRGILVYLLAIAVAAVAGLVISFFIGKPKAIALGDRDAVLISDFTNNTGDAVFDDTLRLGMAVQLAQSPELTLVAEDRIEQTLALMGKPPGTRLTPQLGRQVCERTGSAVLLEGSISTLGTRYVVGIVARNCRNGEVLDEDQEQVAKKEDVLNAVTQIAKRFRTRIGESRPAIERHDTPLADATTPSLDALKAYSTGIRMANESDTSALPFFQRATEIDPDFAMAYAFEGRIYGNEGESAASAASTTRAYELRSRASDRERFWITSAYDMQVTENLEKAQQTCMVWEQSYPRDIFPYAFMAGVIDPVLGKYDQSIEQARKAMTIDPGFAILYYDVALRSADLGRIKDADEALSQADTLGIKKPDVLLAAYDVAFLKHDQEGMKQIEREAQQDPLAEGYILQHKAFVQAGAGQLREADQTMQRASDAARRAGEKEEAVALNLAGEAVWQALAGESASAVHSANAALALEGDRAVEYGAALALAIAGDTVRAQNLARDLEKQFPEDTSVHTNYLPVLRARIALNQGDAAKAISALDTAIPYELGTPRCSIHGNFGALYPVYFRGVAYLAAHRGTEAAAEFQKILDHPGIVLSDTIGALTRLQLARAFAMEGDRAKAKSAYTAFLALWKDADAKLPTLTRARTELARLK